MRTMLSCNHTRAALTRWRQTRSETHRRGSYGRSSRANNTCSAMSRRSWHSSENSCGNSGTLSALSGIGLKKGDVSIRMTDCGESIVGASASTRFGVGGLKSQDASAKMQGSEKSDVRICMLLRFTKNRAIEGEEAVGCRSSSHRYSRVVIMI
jgi:hypothetical protein